MRTPLLRAFDRSHALAQEEFHAKACEPFAERLGQFSVQEWKHAVSPIHQCHFDSQRGKYRGVLASDHAAAHDDEASRDAAHFQDRVGIEYDFVVKRYLRGPVRARARRNQDCLAPQLNDFILRCLDGDGVGVLEGRDALNQVNAVRGQIRTNLFALHLHEDVLAVREILDRQAFAKRIIDSVKPALFQA